jgi:hypothetical protein
VEIFQDFEDLLHVFEKHRVRYLIIGGLAFIYQEPHRLPSALGGCQGVAGSQAASKI